MSQRELPLYPPKITVIDMAYKRAIVNITKAYLYDDRPLYIGYSGGKDSSVIVDLVLKGLLHLKDKGYKLEKKVYVFTSDTLVEMPHVLRMMHTNLDALESFIKKNELPIIVNRIYPDYKNRFFAQILGVGIPLPRQDNRWCTSKMKIMPTENIMSSLLGIDNKKKAVKEDDSGEYFLDKNKNKIYLCSCVIEDGKFYDKNGSKYQLTVNEKNICQKRKYPILNDDRGEYFLDKSKEIILMSETAIINGYTVDKNGNYWKFVESVDTCYMRSFKRTIRKTVVCINGFIAITGSRRDEGTARASRISQATQEGSFLKLNQTYRYSNNLLPIENWNTKDVWNYLFEYSLNWLDDLSLWNLYADASGKGEECAFVGAGDKEVIEDGKVGCAKSRFGCWTCSLFKTDKSMDGLYLANGEQYAPYIQFRDYMMKYQPMISNKTSWALHRDVYKHDTLSKKFYKKNNDIYNPRFGMVMAGGFKLSVRLKLLIKLFKAEQKANERLITDEELLFIQYRWLLEGDISLTLFKAIKKYRGYAFDYLSFVGVTDEINKWIMTIEKVRVSKKLNSSKRVYKKIAVSKITYNRYLIQRFLKKDTSRMFFPTIKDEARIRSNWKSDIVSKEDIKEVISLGGLNIPRTDTLFGNNEIDRAKLPLGLYGLILENEKAEL